MSFDDFVAARTAALLRTAYLLTGDQGLAEDLLQTALVKVAGRWTGMTPGRNPESYVRTVLYREAVSKWRRRRVVEVPREDDLADSMAGRLEDEVTLRVSVARALDELGRRQRACLVLRYFEDLSETATAHALGCSVGTVRSQTYRALQQMRRNHPELVEEVGP